MPGPSETMHNPIYTIHSQSEIQSHQRLIPKRPFRCDFTFSSADGMKDTSSPSRPTSAPRSFAALPDIGGEVACANLGEDGMREGREAPHSDASPGSLRGLLLALLRVPKSVPKGPVSGTVTCAGRPVLPGLERFFSGVWGGGGVRLLSSDVRDISDGGAIPLFCDAGFTSVRSGPGFSSREIDTLRMSSSVDRRVDAGGSICSDVRASA